jgi:aminomuconate-semialdehyde/2-hydroxymuconate-6-semialdehyde dehydrogenase
VDIPRVGSNLRFFAALAQSWSTETHTMPDAINYTLRQPIGVVACISPWNLPLYLFTWKIAPALAVGNCVIGKPSEITPATAHFFSKLCQQAGLPPGVLNIVHGSGASIGDAITSHPGIKAISFTGGTKTGSHIAARVAPTFKKLSLELGGKNPNIIFADCDYEQMLETTLRSSFSNQGQVCLCGSRIYVEDSLYEKFRGDFVQRSQNLKVGDPLEADSKLGAVVSENHFHKILSYVELAKTEGGKILCGGEPAQVGGRCKKGWFILPTVIEGLPLQCRTNQEEIFGPVVTIHPFADESEAIELANGTNYGLSATVWSSNVGRAHRVAEMLDVGVVWINCWLVRDLRTPFGGVKQSGVGREGGLDAFRFFTESKNVCVKYK